MGGQSSRSLGLHLWELCQCDISVVIREFWLNLSQVFITQLWRIKMVG